MNQRQLAKLKKEELSILFHVDSICQKEHLNYFLIGGTLLGAIRHKGFIPWDDDIDIAMPRKDFEQFKKIFKNDDCFEIDSYETNPNYWLPFLKVRLKNTEYREDKQAKYEGKKGIWLDIFPLDNGSSNAIVDKIRFSLTKKIRIIIAEKMRITDKNNNPFKRIVIKIASFLPKKLLLSLQEKIMLNKNEDGEYFVNLGSQYGFYKQRHLKKDYFPSAKHEFEGSSFNVPRNYKKILSTIYGKNFMELPPIEKRTTHNPIYIKYSDGEILDNTINDD